MTEESRSPSIDRSVLDQIRMLEGPGRQGLLEKVVGLYLSDSLKVMEKIRSSVGTGDAEALRRAVHTLKSSSANVGACAVSKACRRIEEEAAAGNPPPSGSPELERLEEEYRSVRQELQAILEAGSGEAMGSA